MQLNYGFVQRDVDLEERIAEKVLLLKHRFDVTPRLAAAALQQKRPLELGLGNLELLCEYIWIVHRSRSGYHLVAFERLAAIE